MKVRPEPTFLSASLRSLPWLLLAAAFGMLAWQLGPSEVRAQGVDIEEIFWCEEPESDDELSLDECAEARDSILFNCTACHSFVPIVKSQNTPEEWNALMSTHRDRVAEVSDDEVELITLYLATHFTPDHPVPELPPELENMGTDQAF